VGKQEDRSMLSLFDKLLSVSPWPSDKFRSVSPWPSDKFLSEPPWPSDKFLSEPPWPSDKFLSVSPWPCDCVYWYHFRFMAVSFCSTESISTAAQYVTTDSKIYCEIAKMCRFSSGNWFLSPNLRSFPWLVKGATQLCTSKKECNKLDLTADQYFWLLDHNDWSRWFAIVVPTYMQIQLQFYWWGCQKKKS